MAKYRDRKLGRTYAFAGSDVYADTTARGHMRNAFEAGSGIVSNWDVMESVLDYIFLKMGIDGSSGSVDMPIVMTEAVANLPYSRKCRSSCMKTQLQPLSTFCSYDRNYFRMLLCTISCVRN
jgi:actin-related protein 5